MRTAKKSTSTATKVEADYVRIPGQYEAHNSGPQTDGQPKQIIYRKHSCMEKGDRTPRHIAAEQARDTENGVVRTTPHAPKKKIRGHDQTQNTSTAELIRVLKNVYTFCHRQTSETAANGAP